MPLYASAPIAYDGTVYARIDAARWSRDCTKIEEFLGLVNTSKERVKIFLRRAGTQDCDVPVFQKK